MQACVRVMANHRDLWRRYLHPRKWVYFADGFWLCDPGTIFEASMPRLSPRSLYACYCMAAAGYGVTSAVLQEVANTEQMLLDARSRVAEASAVLNERKTEEQEATEAFRQCKAARDVFSQGEQTI